MTISIPDLGAYAVAKTVTIVLEVGDAQPSASLLQVVKVPALAGLFFVSLGSVIPALSRGLGCVRRWSVVHHQLDELYPLWADLVAISPGIALEPVRSRRRDRLHLRDLDLRLYRRVIEIRDGQLALRSAHVQNVGSYGRSSDLKALIADQAPGSERGSVPLTIDDELTWWTEVAAAYKGQASTPSETART